MPAHIAHPQLVLSFVGVFGFFTLAFGLVALVRWVQRRWRRVAAARPLQLQPIDQIHYSTLIGLEAQP